MPKSVFILVFLLLVPQSHPSPRQRTFGAEDKFEKPVELPAAALAAIKQDPEFIARVHDEDVREQADAQCFQAAEFDLNNDGRRDLVVVGIDCQLPGANILPFWIVRATSKGYEVVLSVPALSLTIERTKAKGFFDVTSAAVVSQRAAYLRFRFDGRKYVKHRAWHAPPE